MIKPKLYVACGPSGSGKSTMFNRLKSENPSLQTFSLDALRHEWYDADNYANAWYLANKDKGFRNKANARFIEMVKQGNDIYVDNTNLTPNSRSFYINEAKKHGYQTVGIVFNVDVDTLLARQFIRGDKMVPAAAVRQQFDSYKPPVKGDGEFDIVIGADKK